MSTTSSAPMPATGSLQLVEAVIERFVRKPNTSKPAKGHKTCPYLLSGL